MSTDTTASLLLKKQLQELNKNPVEGAKRSGDVAKSIASIRDLIFLKFLLEILYRFSVLIFEHSFFFDFSH